MNVRIHRGAHEVGGTCIEVESAGARIVLDVGQPLDADPAIPTPLPDVAGFRSADPSLLGILISHGHQNHWWLIGQVPSQVPVFIGAATSPHPQRGGVLLDGRRAASGGAPFLNDHSAFDTYSLLIETAGRRLFYSADLQAHGRKARLFDDFVQRPPADVDVLLMEGTHLRRDAEPATGRTEREVEHELVPTTRRAMPG